MSNEVYNADEFTVPLLLLPHDLLDRSWSIGLMIAAGMGVTMAAIKYRHGTYLPPLPSQTDPSNSSEVNDGE